MMIDKDFDLLTNLKTAIEILNKNKNLHISLVSPQYLNKRVPVGISLAEHEHSLKQCLKELLLTEDSLSINFEVDVNYDWLLVPEREGSMPYIEAIQKIILAVYDQYKDYRNMGFTTTSLNGSQTITGTKTYNNTGGWLNTGITLNSPPSKICIGDDMEVQGEINADDIKVNGGTLSVSSELDDLKKRNDALKAELDLLKHILVNKGVM